MVVVPALLFSQQVLMTFQPAPCQASISIFDLFSCRFNLKVEIWALWRPG